MRTSLVAVAALVTIFTIFALDCDRVYAADVHDSHAHDTRHEVAPVPPRGQLWPTDEPLRAAMSKIRAAVEAAEPAYGRAQLQAEDARALAQVVEQSVAYMVANCRLPPEPDAALHVLIGRMMTAAGSLNRDAGSDAGLPQLVAVMRDYRSSFDHPGWSDPAR